MNKTISLIANVKVLKPLSEIIAKKGYIIQQQLPVLTLPITNQLMDSPPDIIFISEEVECDDDLTIIETIGLIKEKVNPRFIVQTRPRIIGDPLLSDLVSLAVYDFITSNEFEVNELIRLIENPRHYPDVKDYHNLTRRIIDLPLPDLPNGDLGGPEPHTGKSFKESLSSWIRKPFETMGSLTHSVKEPYQKKVSPPKEVEVTDETRKKNIILPLRRVETTTTPSVKRATNYDNNGQKESKEVKEKPKNPYLEFSIRNKMTTKAVPGKLITVVSAKSRVGCTTIAFNLQRFGGVLITPNTFESSLQLNIIKVENPHEIEESLEKTLKKHDFIIIDSGIHHSVELIQKSSLVVVVTDNKSDSVDHLKRLYEHIPSEKSIIAINKAIPSGITPKDLSKYLQVPIGIVIPLQNGYKENYGRSQSIGPWDIFYEKYLKSII